MRVSIEHHQQLRFGLLTQVGFDQYPIANPLHPTHQLLSDGARRFRK